MHEAAINGNKDRVDLFCRYSWSTDIIDKYRHFSDALEDLGGPVDVQRRGKRPRDYAFDNGHFKLSKHLFTKDMETHLRPIYRSPIHDTFTPKHIGRLVAHWLNEEDAERVLYNKETVEDSLLTCLLHKTRSQTGKDLSELLGTPAKAREQLEIFYERFYRTMQYLLQDPDLAWKLPDHLQKKQYTDMSDFATLQNDLNEVVAIDFSKVANAPEKIQIALDLERQVSYWYEEEQHKKMALGRAEDNLGKFILQQISQVPGITNVPDTVAELIEFLIAERYDESPFLVTVETLIHVLKGNTDIRKPFFRNARQKPGK